ncbi:MAG TPA: TatD family hydrolase [Gammaproteobacteria bacterium]|jgi:TatD DNase family protein|nr:TatD family hydrolase [Gammaproteobacteria bacterium]
MTDVTPTRAAKLVDIGANLTHGSFDADRPEVIERARAAGVGRFVVTGSDAEHSRKALDLSGQYPDIYATAGVHPHHAKDVTAVTPDELRKLLENPRVVAVGECGLDYFRNFSPPEVQREAFEMQLGLAEACGKPVFLHQRDAHADFMRILAAHRPRLSKAVVHCFTGDAAELRAYLSLDCYIGITGWICDERRGRHLRECVGLIPADRLMLETDAPYLIPRDLDPKPASNRNEPMHLPHIAKIVAACLDKPMSQLIQETTRVAEAFFGLG